MADMDFDLDEERAIELERIQQEEQKSIELQIDQQVPPSGSGRAPARSPRGGSAGADRLLRANCSLPARAVFFLLEYSSHP